MLVVDCDPQANATAGLGVDPSSSGNNMYEVFMSGIDDFPTVMVQDIIRRTASGIDLAPAHLDMVGAEPYLYHAEFPTGVLKEALDPLKNRYHIFLLTHLQASGNLSSTGFMQRIT